MIIRHNALPIESFLLFHVRPFAYFIASCSLRFRARLSLKATMMDSVAAVIDIFSVLIMMS